MGLTIRGTLPASWPSLTTIINLPPVYHSALVSNLGMDLRPKYGIGTWPGDQLPRIAKRGLAVLKSGNAQIPNLAIPPGLSRGGIYDIYSDRNY